MNFIQRYTKNVSNILHNYYDVMLPNETIAAILNSDAELRCEINAGGINDTVTREMIIDSVSKFLGMSRQWPTYGTDKNEANVFFAELAVKIKAIGGEFGQY